ncbi:MAG: hypothetical protein HN350_17990 [Phycisphaerales bacterium]|jgi:hypothetical protein|nr:hypothetical protein [Phycisphaerales bacterium]
MLGLIGSGPSEHYDVLIWGSIGGVAIMLLGFGLLWFRKKFHPDNIEAESLNTSFSIENIEDMRARGNISDDEFRRLRNIALGLAPPSDNNDNSLLSTTPDVDDSTTEEVNELDPSHEPQDYKENK